MSIRKNLLDVLASPTACKDIYNRVRVLYPSVHALCAATQSELDIRAGALTEHYPWAADYYAQLRAHGWIHGHDLKALEPGDKVFTVDANHNGSPDHTFVVVEWLDKEKMVALVYDNYQPAPHPRNVGAACIYKGKRLAYGRGVDLFRPPT